MGLASGGEAAADAGVGGEAAGDAGVGGEAAGSKWPGPCVEERDVRADGTVDERRTYTYDADGNRLTEERDGYDDHGADGTVDSRATYTYACWE